MRRTALLLLATVLACGGAGPTGLDPSQKQQSDGGDAGAPPGDPPDSGVDGGEPDAGHPDAGQPEDTTPLPLRRSPIADENQLPGSRSWQLDSPSDEIAAYANRTSALPGEAVEIHAGAATATTATWELWRLGYYGGTLGRRIAKGGPVTVPAWTPAVMDPVKGAVILYPMSTNTYQAYNNWGGTGLYNNSRSDWPYWHAFAVSFDRPYQNRGAGELLSNDRSFITFAEAQGYDIAYVSDADLDADPNLVKRRRMVLFQGHTEYWTMGMRDTADKAIAAGTNVAFLAANSAYWQVRYADASRRTMIGYKEFAYLDPANQTDPLHLTARFRDPPLNRPENAMAGEMFGAWQWVAAPLSIKDPSHWLWRGAGVDANTMIPGVYSGEVDNRGDPRSLPAGVSVLAGTMTENHGGDFQPGESTLYTAASGAQVFSAGSIKWSATLARARSWDPRIQQATANLFSVFAGDGNLPATLEPMSLPDPAPAPNYRGGVQVRTITRSLTAPRAVAAAPNGDAIIADKHRILRVTPNGTVNVVAGATWSGYADGPAGSAVFSDPHGITVASDGTIYVADTKNNRIRSISNGTVKTLAGSEMGFADGKGAAAMFTWPMGITLTTSGTILVADTWNYRIREVGLDGTVRTWAGTGERGLDNGPGAKATLMYPMSMAARPGGDALLIEPESGMIRKVSSAPTHDVTVLLGNLGVQGWSDGTVSWAEISETIAAAVRADGQVVFLDSASARVRALRNGVVDTLAGGVHGGTVDGNGPDAGFGFPRGVAVAPDGSILVVDLAERALRRVTPQ